MRFDYYLLIVDPTREIKGEFETLRDTQAAALMFGEDTYYVLGYSKPCGYVIVMDTEDMKKFFEEDF